MNFPLLTEKNNEKTYRGARYFKIRLPETISKLSKAFGQTKVLQWSALLDNYVLFAESEDLIKHIISNYRDGQRFGSKVLPIKTFPTPFPVVVRSFGLQLPKLCLTLLNFLLNLIH